MHEPIIEANKSTKLKKKKKKKSKKQWEITIIKLRFWVLSRLFASAYVGTIDAKLVKF